jgi:hypothetical protein
MDDESFEEDLRHNLSESIVLDFQEEVKEQRAEPVGVRIGISEVQDNSAKEVVLS